MTPPVLSRTRSVPAAAGAAAATQAEIPPVEILVAGTGSFDAAPTTHYTGNQIPYIE